MLCEAAVAYFISHCRSWQLQASCLKAKSVIWVWSSLLLLDCESITLIWKYCVSLPKATSLWYMYMMVLTWKIFHQKRCILVTSFHTSLGQAPAYVLSKYWVCLILNVSVPSSFSINLFHWVREKPYKFSLKKTLYYDSTKWIICNHFLKGLIYFLHLGDTML